LLGLGLLAIIFGVLLAPATMYLYLARKRSRRIFAFTEQLPDAIDIIVRGVRVGLPFSSAVSLVAREMSDPIGTEFGMLADEIAFGLDVQTALQNLNRRVGQEDLLFLTVSLSIQTRTGGNIAEILSRLSRMMRNRAAMRLKVRALTADSRASALLLSAFPFILVVLISIVAPTYFDAVRASPLFGAVVVLGLILLVVGNFIMYRMLNFKY
jgi:tight adherence protein B